MQSSNTNALKDQYMAEFQAEAAAQSEHDFNLDLTPLIFAFMHKLGIKAILDSRLRKTSSNFVVDHSEIIMMLIARCLTMGFTQGLHAVSNFASTLPLNALFKRTDVELTGDNFNIFAIGRTLDEIAYYGSTSLSVEVFADLIARCDLTEKIHTVKIDTTSKTVYVLQIPEEHEEQYHEQWGGMVRDEAYPIDKKAALTKFGYSRDGNPDQPQVNILNIASSVSETGGCFPLCTNTYSGNISDVTQMGDVLEDCLGDMTQKYPNLKYIVGDSALASGKNINMIKSFGLHVVGRLADGRVRKQIKNAARDKLEFMSITLKGDSDSSDSEVTCNAAWAGFYDFKDPENQDKVTRAKLLAVESTNLRDKKAHTVEKKVTKEQKTIEAAVKRLNRTEFNCKQDAEKSADEVIKKFQPKFHHYDVDIQAIGHHKTRGNPGKKEPDFYTYKYTINLQRDEAAIELSIKEDSFYVLFTTDCNANDAEALVKCYHSQSEIEAGWKESKTPGMFIDSFFVTKHHRRCALMFVVSLAQFVGKYLLKMVHQSIQEHDVALDRTAHYHTSRPNLASLNEVFSRSKIGLTIDVNGGTTKVRNLCKNFFVWTLLKHLGKEFSEFYTPEYYQSYIGLSFNQAYQQMLAQFARDLKKSLANS